MVRHPRPLERRRLTPRDYLQHPHDFGSLTRSPQWWVPEGGDARSLLVALVAHEMARRVAERKDPHDAALVCGRFGFSKQHWSRCLNGWTWMGETTLSALIWLLDQPLSPAGVRAGGRVPDRTSLRERR